MINAKTIGLNNISDHISYNEAIKSATALKKGISNTPDLRQLTIMRHLAINLFEPVRRHFNEPIFISSFYRSPKLNKVIGGAKFSDHMILEDVAAIDMDNDRYTSLTRVSNADIFWFIYDNLNYYKLIWEFGDRKKPDWVHISFSMDDAKNRQKNTMYAHKPGHRVLYQKFNESKFLRV